MDADLDALLACADAAIAESHRLLDEAHRQIAACERRARHAEYLIWLDRRTQREGRQSSETAAMKGDAQGLVAFAP
ncbi:hypothetical protein JQ586_33225 [Bradyrhizobium jicamae]|nr:hypothetical protein [Bradyrhizobium jicamae]